MKDDELEDYLRMWDILTAKMEEAASTARKGLLASTEEGHDDFHQGSLLAIEGIQTLMKRLEKMSGEELQKTWESLTSSSSSPTQP
jgi:hypothetical protein